MVGEAKAKPAPVIAEATDSLTQFLRQYEPPTLKEGEKNLLGGRYKIHAEKPLAAFNTTLARAFAATDNDRPERPCYALLCASGYAPRVEAIQALKQSHHPNLANVLEAGVVSLAGGQGKFFCVVLEQPQGRTLASLMAENPSPLPDRFVRDTIIVPLADALQALEKKGLRHGRINLENIYLADTATLGEGIGEPCGYSQPYLYDPVNLQACMQAGKGESANGADAYALGLVALQLVLGRVFTAPEKTQFGHLLRERGAYQYLINESRVPDSLGEFFRGTLTDSAYERWRMESIVQWAGGKKTSAPPAISANESTRPYLFMNNEYNNRRALAGAFSSAWEEARTETADHKLLRWVELGLRLPALAAELLRLHKGMAPGQKPNDETLCRTLMALDPEGPLRLPTVGVMPDGVGDLLCAALFGQQTERLQAVSDIIDYDLSSAWSTAQKPEAPLRAATAAAKMQKLRSTLRSNAPGSGMERCLYELNPHLPCAGSAVAGLHIATLSELLLALNTQATAFSIDAPFYDKHLLAFIGSRVDAYEIKVPVAGALPCFKTLQDAAALKLFAQAQQKSGIGALPGLAAWFGLRLLPHAGKLHSHDLQGHLASRLCEAAVAGDLTAMFDLVCNQELAALDDHGYTKALQLWHAQDHAIKLMQHPAWLAERAREASEKISPILAYIVFGVMAYVSFFKSTL